jgi:hypothetical protein
VAQQVAYLIVEIRGDFTTHSGSDLAHLTGDAIEERPGQSRPFDWRNTDDRRLFTFHERTRTVCSGERPYERRKAACRRDHRGGEEGFPEVLGRDAEQRDRDDEEEPEAEEVGGGHGRAGWHDVLHGYDDRVSRCSACFVGRIAHYRSMAR